MIKFQDGYIEHNYRILDLKKRNEIKLRKSSSVLLTMNRVDDEQLLEKILFSTRGFWIITLNVRILYAKRIKNRIDV